MKLCKWIGPLGITPLPVSLAILIFNALEDTGDYEIECQYYNPLENISRIVSRFPVFKTPWLFACLVSVLPRLLINMSLVQIYRAWLPASYKLALELCFGLVILVEASLAAVVLSDTISHKNLHAMVLSSLILTSAAFLGLCYFFESKINADIGLQKIIKVRRRMVVAMYGLLLVTGVSFFLHFQFCLAYAFTVVNLTEYIHIVALLSHYTLTYILVCQLKYQDQLPAFIVLSELTIID